VLHNVLGYQHLYAIIVKHRPLALNVLYSEIGNSNMEVIRPKLAVATEGYVYRL
jgi:hypothetical protein